MAEQTLILWGFGLLAASLLLIVIEAFIPSGGVIGLTAGVSAVASVVVFWRVGPGWGVLSMLLLLVLAPIALNFALRLLPNTPVGKRLILGEDEEDARRRASAEIKQSETERSLLGATGVAVTALRLVGTVMIDGQRIEAIAEGGAIEPGTPVRVTSVQGSTIKVRATA